MAQQDDPSSGLEKITDTIGDIVSGVPTPVRKGFLKAFDQLCGAAVDIPVTWLEGKKAEMQATTAARVQIIKTGGDKYAENLEVPNEYISRANEKYAAKIIKEQISLDEITLNAARNLADHKYVPEPEIEPLKEGMKEAEDEHKAEVGDDWLNEFENYAKLKSSDEMKVIFGKILSGEILKPGTFSIKTIRLISQLDNKAAQLFQRMCSMAVSLEVAGNVTLDSRVVSFSGSAASNSLSNFGLSFDYLNVLQEYGLIISDYNSHFPYGGAIVNEQNRVGGVIRFKNNRYVLVPTNREKVDKNLRLNGVALTGCAKELQSIIPLLNLKEYETALVEFFKGKHLSLTPMDK